MSLMIAGTYVLELKLYDFRLFKRAITYVFVEHISQLHTNLAPLWGLGVYWYGSGTDSLREQCEVVCEGILTFLVISTIL
jgi:hypothetical protein